MAVAREPGESRINIADNFKARLQPVNESVPNKSKIRESLLSRLKRNPKEVILATFALILGTAIPAGIVNLASEKRPNESSWSKGEGRNDPNNRHSPSLRATLDAQKMVSATKTAVEEKKIQEKVDAYNSGLIETTLHDSPPLPTKTPEPVSEQASSVPADRAQTNPSIDSSLPTPTMIIPESFVQPTPNPLENISPLVDGVSPSKK